MGLRLSAFCLLVSGPLTASTAESAVLVEALTSNGAAIEAGLRVGDTIERCTSGTRVGASAELATPISLIRCEESAAGETAVLWVERDGETLRIDIGPGAWGIEARPRLDSEATAELARLGRAVRDDDATATEAVLVSLRGSLEASPERLVWLDLHHASLLEESGDIEAAERALERAARDARASSDPDLVLAAVDARLAGCDARGAPPAECAEIAEKAAEAAAELGEESLVYAARLHALALRRRVTGDWDEAVRHFEHALEIRRRHPPDLRMADTLGELSYQAYRRNEPELADELFAEAIAIARRIDPRDLRTGRILQRRGFAVMSRGDVEEARRIWTEARDIFEELGESQQVGVVLANLSVLEHRAGDVQRAYELLRRALELIEPGSHREALIRANLSTLSIERGRLAEAQELIREAHETLLRLGVSDLAESYSMLGHAARARGDLAAAEEAYLAALEQARKLGMPRGIAGQLHNLGSLAQDREDLVAARSYYQSALSDETVREADQWGTALTLSELGEIELRAGNLAAAEGYVRQALQRRREMASEGPDVAASLRQLGDLARLRGRPNAALAHYREALAMHRAVAAASSQVATDLVRIGLLELELGRRADAESALAEALRIRRRLLPSTAMEAEAAYALGRLRLEQERRAETLDLYGSAVRALDEQWLRLGGSEESRLTWAASHAEIYRAYIDLLVASGDEEGAFAILERQRARVLRDLLAERDLELPTTDSVRRLEEARIDLAVERERILRRLADLGGADTAEEQSLLDELAELRTERERLEASVRAEAPAFADLKYPTPLSASEVATVLGPGAVLVAFSVGTGSTVVFALGRSADGRAELRAARIEIGADALRDRVETLRGLLARRDPAELDELERVAGGLYRDLLAPLEPQLATAERLLVSADGPLQRLPFGVLRSGRGYLIESRSLSTVPSATLYATLRGGRPEGRSGTVVAFGDPLYRRGSLEEPDDRSQLAPLPASRIEVEALREELALPVVTYLGAQATEERAKAIGPDARVIHFATHAVLDEKLPLSSALALASPKEDGTSTENGMLYAWEVFEQIRLDADLVTLSACETALGREASGEGLLGLVWAFHFAGARSVLGSLWRVEDTATAEVMRRFYRGIAAGLPKHRALREAQLGLIRSGDRETSGPERGVGGLTGEGVPAASHPFYWASFQLSGD